MCSCRWFWQLLDFLRRTNVPHGFKRVQGCSLWRCNQMYHTISANIIPVGTWKSTINPKIVSASCNAAWNIVGYQLPEGFTVPWLDTTLPSSVDRSLTKHCTKMMIVNMRDLYSDHMRRSSKESEQMKACLLTSAVSFYLRRVLSFRGI